MKNRCNLDFSIRRLGDCHFQSPVQLSYIDGDLIANFVEDSEGILYNNRLTGLQACVEKREEPLYFEEAGPRDKIFFNPQDITAAIVTCGGLCPGINDVIRGLVISLNLIYGVKNILGIRYGFAGLVERSMLMPIELTPHVVEDINKQGGTFLGSSRGPQPIEEMVDFLVKRGINLLFTIGGDGTLRGALAIAEEVQKRGLNISIVGIPKTIDNDIQYIERSFGFETAYTVANNVLLSAHAEATGSYNGIVIVKLMGRHSGSLAANAAISSGEVNFILVPEVPFDLEPPNGFLAELEKRILRRHHALVVVAEGAGQEFFSDTGEPKVDKSGNVKLGDIGTYLFGRVQKHFMDRGIEASVRYIDPSYYVRSLEAIPSDRMLCLQLAQNAVHAAMAGRTGMVVGLWNSAFTHIPIQAAVSERKVINPDGDFWLTVLQTTGQPNQMIN